MKSGGVVLLGRTARVVTGGLLAVGLLASPAAATDIGEYLSGEKPVVYGDQVTLDLCSNIGPRSPLKFRLWAKESGQWRVAAPARIRKSASQCGSPDAPYLHRYVWTVDALGTKASPLRYDLQLAFGARLSTATKFVVPEYRSDTALGQHYMCVIENKNDPGALDALC